MWSQPLFAPTIIFMAWGSGSLMLASMREGDSRWSEEKFHQRRGSRDVSTEFTEGTLRVREGATSVGDSGCKLGETEDKGDVHGCNKDCCDEEAEGAGAGPSVAPAEIFSGDDKPDSDAPKLPCVQRCFQMRMLCHVPSSV
ncbi:hypothetical protein HDF17_002352 [Granulicella arctica]|uniref:Uncharacterized protein n=1 Tax=Granulicella arctica TaxID=940613 RepID=A0A7Y9PHK2_9BACT|nr:hypothetical protein [Granulicella arctica]